jgi:hypothetical protein
MGLSSPPQPVVRKRELCKSDLLYASGAWIGTNGTPDLVCKTRHTLSLLWTATFRLFQGLAPAPNAGTEQSCPELTPMI